MYELTVKTRKQLERATLRAQAEKPRIEEVSYGIYKVWSTNPAKPDTYYSVGIEPAKTGEGYDVLCTCPTQPRIDRKTGEIKDCFCKHVAACMPHYQMKEREYKAEEARMAARTQPVEDPEVLYADLIPSFDDEFKPSPLVRPIEYTAEMEAHDRACLFG